MDIIKIMANIGTSLAMLLILLIVALGILGSIGVLCYEVIQLSNDTSFIIGSSITGILMLLICPKIFRMIWK